MAMHCIKHGLWQPSVAAQYRSEAQDHVPVRGTGSSCSLQLHAEAHPIQFNNHHRPFQSFRLFSDKEEQNVHAGMIAQPAIIKYKCQENLHQLRKIFTGTYMQNQLPCTGSLYNTTGNHIVF